MKAVQIEEFGEPDGLVLADLPAPVPGPEEVLVEVHAAGVNFPDILVVAGTYQTLFPLPFTPGKEGAGIVRAVGRNVTHVAPGDRVTFLKEAGAYAEFVSVRHEFCFPLPDAIAMPDGASLGLAFQTAFFALTEDARLKEGEWVLVLGATGGVGTAAVQLAKALGAHVIAAVGTPAKREFVEQLGADAIVDVSNTEAIGNLRNQISGLTGRPGVDIVMDPIGGNLFDGAIRTLLPGGRHIILGFAAGAPALAKTNYLLIKRVSVIGSNWGYFRDHATAQVGEVQQRIFDLFLQGKLNSPVSRIFPLSRIREALKEVGNRTIEGKIVIQMPAGQESDS